MIHRSHSLTSDRSNINKISRRNIGGLGKTTVALNEQEEWRIFIICSYKIIEANELKWPKRVVHRLTNSNTSYETE